VSNPKLDEKPLEPVTTLFQQVGRKTSKESLQEKALHSKYADSKGTRKSKMCPLKDEGWICESSRTTPRGPSGEIIPFLCTQMDYYQGCEIYLRHLKEISEAQTS